VNPRKQRSRVPCLEGFLGRGWRILRRTVTGYLEIDGDQRAAAFAFYAFFSLFPLLLLIVSAGALFLDPRDVTASLIDYLNSYIPLSSADREGVYETLRGVASSSGKLGLVAGLGLLWSSSRFFHALVRAVNRAWHTVELEWWKVPVKSVVMLLLLALALVVGIIAPLVFSAMARFVPWDHRFFPVIVHWTQWVLPFAVLYMGLLVLYSLSPRQRVPLRHVWRGALLAALGIKLLQWLLVVNTEHFWKVNVLYGAVGVLILLLFWVYLLGAIIILGACFCAASKERS
jgi:YihY family inner membrane protein